MSFRDEDAAREERIRLLEGELAESQAALEAARQETEQAKRDAGDGPSLRRRVGLLEGEIAELRRGRRTPSGAAPIFGVGLLVAVVTVAIVITEREEVEAASERERATSEALRSTELRLADESRRADDLVAELAAAREEAARPAPADDPIPAPFSISDALSIRTSTTFLTDARVASVEGAAPVVRGATCSVAVTLGSDDECRAQILCGDRSLYPGEGHGGYFACEHDDARQVTHGADVNTSDISSDPRLDFDRARGTAIVEDGPSPAWTVTLRFHGAH